MTHHGMKCALTVLIALLPGLWIQAGEPPRNTFDQPGDAEKQIHLSLNKLLEGQQELLRLFGDLQLAQSRQQADFDRLARRVQDLEGRLNRPFSLTRATISLVNSLPVQATVVIDGTAYTVPARRSLTLTDQNERALTYRYTAEGYGWSEARQKFLKGGNTWTLMIHEP